MDVGRFSKDDIVDIVEEHMWHLLALTPEEHEAAKTKYPDKEGYGTGKNL